MPHATINGIEIYYEEHGAGEPLVWTHEYAGDYRTWEPQMDDRQRAELYRHWKRAVERTFGWIEW